MILKCDISGQQIDFDIPEKYKKIGVNCSGGADSSILLLMVVQYLIENNRTDTTVSVSTCSNDIKGRWNGRRAADVIEYVLKKTKFQNFDLHYTYYRDVQDEKYFHEVEGKLLYDKRIDMFVSGITCNPPFGSTAMNVNGEKIVLSDDMILSRTGTNHKIWHYVNDNAFYTPFANVDKRFVASMYNKYDANDLFNLTRSCEAIPDENEDMQIFENTPCGKCWWCLERKWAFGRF